MENTTYDFTSDEMYKEIQTTDLMINLFFNTLHKNIKISNLDKYYKHIGYPIANEDTMEEHITEINHYVSAIHFGKYPYIDYDNPRTNEFKIPQYTAEYKQLNLPNQLFYQRMYYYLYLNKFWNKKNLFLSIRKSSVHPLFFPLLVGIIYCTKTGKQSYEKMKVAILETVEKFQTKEYYNYFSLNAILSFEEFMTTLIPYYKYWLDLFLPNELYEFYQLLISVKNSNFETNTPDSRFDNLVLNQIIHTLPQYSFLTPSGYKLFYSQIIYALQNSLDPIQVMPVFEKLILQTEYSLWNQVILEKSQA